MASLLGYAKRNPLLSSLKFALYDRYWRARISREWAAQYRSTGRVIDTDGAPEPSLSSPTSQLCTASQFTEGQYRYWCREMRAHVRLARKQWEFVFALEALRQAGMLAPGKRGLGFGCGEEPLPAVLAKHGCSVLATDQSIDAAVAQGWTASHEHAASLAALNKYGVCGSRVFRERVAFEPADMNAIPERYAGQFDFVWSCCAFEHLGSIRHGLDFVKNAMRSLKPGGVAVHTTEFNLSSNDRTLEDPGCVLFRRRDMGQLRDELAAIGYRVAPFNFNPGAQPVDQHIDAPPYSASPHLKVELQGYVTTSIGLIIRA